MSPRDYRWALAGEMPATVAGAELADAGLGQAIRHRLDIPADMADESADDGPDPNAPPEAVKEARRYRDEYVRRALKAAPQEGSQ
jgi:hypothetical protein